MKQPRICQACGSRFKNRIGWNKDWCRKCLRKREIAFRKAFKNMGMVK